MLRFMAIRLTSNNNVQYRTCRLVSTRTKRKLKEKGVIKKRGASAAQAPKQPTTPAPKQQQEKQSNGKADPLMILVALFPLVAAGIAVAVKPELREQVMANHGVSLSKENEKEQSPSTKEDSS